jgi:DNA-binding PadR family transcriptional regulator
MASVPKGFLRHYVLRLLNENPISGSEIMSTIAERTDDRWHPSPGSVYPLLSWLLDSGYTEIGQDQEAGIKRYSLTEKGKEFLAEHDERHPDFDERVEDTGPRFRGDRQIPEGAKDLYKSFRELGHVRRQLFHQLKKEYSEVTVKEATEEVNEFLKKMKALIKTTEV